jgi:hypothetical protein
MCQPCLECEENSPGAPPAEFNKRGALHCQELICVWNRSA